MSKSQIVRVPFHAFNIITLVAGANTAQLTPSLTTISPSRLATESDGFAHYRIAKYKFRILVPPTAPSGSSTMAFVGGVQDTAPGSQLQAMEEMPCAILLARQTVHSDWVNVPKAILQGPFPWYKTVAGSADTTEETPGYLAFNGTGTEGVYFEVKGVYEFKTPVATANTPVALALLAKIRKERRDAIVRRARERLLGTIPTGE